MTTWLREQASIVPLPPAAPNVIDPPYPVPTTTFGWAAGDAAYAMDAFELADDEALVIRGRSPECVFWNLCLWNSLLHTYNYDYERVTINGAQAVYEEDGSWTPPELGVDGGAPERPDLDPLAPARPHPRASAGHRGPGGQLLSGRPVPAQLDVTARPSTPSPCSADLPVPQRATSRLPTIACYMRRQNRHNGEYQRIVANLLSLDSSASRQVAEDAPVSFPN
jgi:hypothetical protein